DSFRRVRSLRLKGASFRLTCQGSYEFTSGASMRVCLDHESSTNSHPREKAGTNSLRVLATASTPAEVRLSVRRLQSPTGALTMTATAAATSPTSTASLQPGFDGVLYDPFRPIVHQRGRRPQPVKVSSLNHRLRRSNIL